MNYRSQNSLASCLIASVWICSGLFCKVLHWVPRHQAIVARILGTAYAPQFTTVIGLAETVLGIFILTGRFRRMIAIFQMATIAFMNILEFLLASDLLLWGRLNALFAFLFILFIYRNQFHTNKNFIVPV